MRKARIQIVPLCRQDEENDELEVDLSHPLPNQRVVVGEQSLLFKAVFGLSACK